MPRGTAQPPAPTQSRLAAQTADAAPHSRRHVAAAHPANFDEPWRSVTPLTTQVMSCAEPLVEQLDRRLAVGGDRPLVRDLTRAGQSVSDTRWRRGTESFDGDRPPSERRSNSDLSGRSDKCLGIEPVVIEWLAVGIRGAAIELRGAIRQEHRVARQLRGTRASAGARSRAPVRT